MTDELMAAIEELTDVMRNVLLELTRLRQTIQEEAARNRYRRD